MQEQKLKRRLFVFLLIAKVLIIGLIFFHWDTGGFSRSEMLALVGMILPLFTIYTSIIWKDFFGQPLPRKAGRRNRQKIQSRLSVRQLVFLYFLCPFARIFHQYETFRRLVVYRIRDGNYTHRKCLWGLFGANHHDFTQSKGRKLNRPAVQAAASSWSFSRGVRPANFPTAAARRA